MGFLYKQAKKIAAAVAVKLNQWLSPVTDAVVAEWGIAPKAQFGAWSPARSEWIVGGSANGLATISLSNDGITWTSRSAQIRLAVGSTQAISCGIWSSEHNWYIVGTTDGRIATSPDGITWTNRPSIYTAFGSTVKILKISWIPELSKYVATGYRTYIDGNRESQRIATSPDGITWTNRSANISASLGGGMNTKQCYSHAYGAGLLVVTGINGSSPRLSTSSDGGITWVARSPTGMINSVMTVEWNGTNFVSCGANGRAMVSNDGITWTSTSTSYTAAVGTGQMTYSLTWTGDQFIAVGGGAATSPDGITWSINTALNAIAPPNNVLLNSISHNSEQALAVGFLYSSVASLIVLTAK